MMNILKNVSITRKLTLLTVLAVSVSTTLCCAAFLLNDVKTLKAARLKQISSLANVLGFNSTVAIEFRDKASAEKTLSSLEGQPEIELAALYDEAGELFATYPRGLDREALLKNGNSFMEVSREILDSSPDDEEDDSILSPDNFAGRSTEPSPFKMVSFRNPNASESAALGSIVVRANLNDIQKQIATRTIVTSGVLVGALIIGVAISRFFQRSITEPIRSLVESARYISRNEDFTHRATVFGNDELGELTEAFNQMVAEVQVGREQLQMANDELEMRVEDRTRELEKLNENLKQEMKERTALKEELITASRHAGMAEVATGVLHNVGNVLNSVNVSANLLMDQLQNSRVDTLRKAYEVIESNRENLAEFVTKDPRGKHFPKLLGELSGHLAQQREAQLQEITLLLKNIEHVKEIISMQQTYARMRGAAEAVDLVGLIEDSLRITDTSLSRHGVRVIKEFQPTRPINSEKHKILQILTNLITNAKNALDECDIDDKTITLRIHESGDRVCMEVEDNGIGISEENLTKIFNHGFTTRKDGHGFGLHSCALAAQELGGSLTVHSDGPGKGARFVLQLPLDRKSDSNA